MLELVPFACTCVDREVEFVRESLQLSFPHVGEATVVVACVSRDEEFSRSWVALQPIRFDQASMDVTANNGVSWSVPTFTKPSLAAMS